MDETVLPETESSERRRARRAWVPGIAVIQSGAQAPTVWRVSNLSPGGAGLVGDGRIAPERLTLALHVAGHPAMELQAKVLRRQVLTRGGRCAVKFVDLTEDQQRALREVMAAEHMPSAPRRRALIVTSDEVRARALSSELVSLGLVVRREASPGQAVAWLQREETEVLLVDESVVDASRWNVLQVAQDTAPDVRRLVIANDVRGFRLYYAIKAGLVEGLVEPQTASEALARHLTGAPATKAARRRAAR